MIIGLPSCAGMSSLGVAGACCPTAGVSAVCTAGGDIHDQNSVCQVMVRLFQRDWSLGLGRT